MNEKALDRLLLIAVAVMVVGIIVGMLVNRPDSNRAPQAPTNVQAVAK